MKETWNERYRQPIYAYGEAPNVFFENQLTMLPAGKLLLPAEGEGRNAVFAATKGWQVTAFDFSVEGRKKALALAEKNKVEINYVLSDAAEFKADEAYDVLGLFFTHFEISERQALFSRFIGFLKPGGTVIMEVFSKNQLGRTSGGPKDLNLLYNIPEIRILFPEFRFKILEEATVHLDEGPFHQGEAMVIRVVGKKQG